MTKEMTKEEITQLANILYKKVMEWVEATPEEDRQDVELIEAIDELELPEKLQGTWTSTNPYTEETYTYDVTDILRACFYSSTYDNDEPITVGLIEGFIEQGIENVECGI